MIPVKNLSLKELKMKYKCKPYGGKAGPGLSQVISLKKKTHSEDEFRILGIGRNMTMS